MPAKSGAKFCWVTISTLNEVCCDNKLRNTGTVMATSPIDEKRITSIVLVAEKLMTFADTKLDLMKHRCTSSFVYTLSYAQGLNG